MVGRGGLQIYPNADGGNIHWLFTMILVLEAQTLSHGF